MLLCVQCIGCFFACVLPVKDKLCIDLIISKASCRLYTACREACLFDQVLGLNTSRDGGGYSMTLLLLCKAKYRPHRSQEMSAVPHTVHRVISMARLPSHASLSSLTSS